MPDRSRSRTAASVQGSGKVARSLGQRWPSAFRALSPSAFRALSPSAFRALSRDRRGATAAIFGVTAVVVVGFAGLATEAGRWYDIRRDMQNAADVAAVAGAQRLQIAYAALNQPLATSQLQGRNTGVDTAGRNGFTTSGTATVVTANAPPATGGYVANDRAVEVIITSNERRLISSLFLAGANQAITTRGVAAIQAIGPACVLALEGGLQFSGSTTVSGPNCIFASNATGSDSIRLNGGPAVTALSFRSVGGCTNCDQATLSAPPTRGATDDPFAFAANVPLPASFTGFAQPPNNIGNGNSWTTGAMNTTSWTPAPLTTRQPYYAFTGDVRLNNGETMLLRSGTYFFTNGASLTLNGSANLCLISCGNPAPSTLDPSIGVTLVFLRGNNGRPGDVTLNGGGVLQVQAPSTGPYAGLLIYRQAPTASQVGQGNEVIINGTNNSSRIAGGIYVPRADLDFLGNATVAQQGCMVLVGGAIKAGGTSTASVGTCNILRNNLAPQVRVVRLVE